MSDRVCVMRDGRIVQTGTSSDLYDEPANRYVADFMGRSNFFGGTVRETQADAAEVELDAGFVAKARLSRSARPLRAGEKITFSVRPEQMTITRAASALPDGSPFRSEAQILNRIFLGEHTEYLVREDRLGDFLVLSPRQAEMDERHFAVGDRVHVGWRQQAAVALPTE